VNDDVWQTIANNGINIRRSYVDPSQGWIASTRWGQRGPFATREEALAAALQVLVERIEALEQQERRGGDHSFFGFAIEALIELFSFSWWT
jgi:hypothetical protein